MNVCVTEKAHELAHSSTVRPKSTIKIKIIDRTVRDFQRVDLYNDQTII